MWVILPIKKLTEAKVRLAEVLTEQQRIELSRLMCADVLATLESSELIKGITVITSDETIAELATHEKTEFLITDEDRGYCEDAMTAIEMLDANQCHDVLVIPSDIPQITPDDLEQLRISHQGGITLCPASEDGGTNAILYTPPLSIPLLFGPDSFSKYCEAAAKKNINVVIAKQAGLLRDIDRYDDLHWLSQQTVENRSAEYSRMLIQ